MPYRADSRQRYLSRLRICALTCRHRLLRYPSQLTAHTSKLNVRAHCFFPGYHLRAKQKRQHLLSSPCGSLAVLAVGYALPLSNIHVKSGLAMLAPELEVFCLRLRISFLVRPLLAVWTSISSILDFECSRFFYPVQELSLTF